MLVIEQKNKNEIEENCAKHLSKDVDVDYDDDHSNDCDNVSTSSSACLSQNE